MLSRVLCLLIVVYYAKVDSANILALYPVPSISHQVVFRRVTLELVRQGHNVTVVTPDPAFPNKNGPDNLNEIDLHDISYATIRREMETIDKKDLNKIVSDPKFFSRFTQRVFETQMQLKEVQDVIRDNNTKYDLILMEEIMRPYLAVSYFIKAPVILFSSFGGMSATFEAFGMQTHPVLYPIQFDLRVYNLSLLEKIEKYRNYYNMLYQQSIILKEEHQLLQKFFGPDIPEISELYKNVHMLFLNNHPVWVDNQPVPPNVIYLGGLHQLPSKELPQDLKTYLDSSKHGVIYVSFGTNALSNMLESNKIQMIAKVLGQLPYDVLWKWDQDTLPGQTKNIRLSKWLPQADLLKHPKIKLFITQAGLQSTDEAITAGVPLLAFPVLGDQWYNAEKYERHGIGKKYLFEEINEEIVNNAVEEIIENKRYRENILRLQKIMNDQPLKPLERAIFWIDHIIRNKGGKHLIPAAANKTWAQYYEFDLVLLLLLTVSVSLASSSYLLYALYKNITKHFRASRKLKRT
ncbi:UDP-glycosyltransferase UGT5-like [Aricia agestis]|uniref:UDP-glycosyltransferase UGT5-like n=1 Tax=Aricia agestis TaxID=91739 RepID=UPI001C209888|nr:UDP-glycosyltransferase UGT5-like [Aricia agestis]